jgi:hypothetical protein
MHQPLAEVSEGQMVATNIAEGVLSVASATSLSFSDTPNQDPREWNSHPENI